MHPTTDSLPLSASTNTSPVWNPAGGDRAPEDVPVSAKTVALLLLDAIPSFVTLLTRQIEAISPTQTDAELLACAIAGLVTAPDQAG